MKKISFYNTSYFSDPNSHNRNEIKVKSDLPNPATKSNNSNSC